MSKHIQIITKRVEEVCRKQRDVAEESKGVCQEAEAFHHQQQQLSIQFNQGQESDKSPP